MSKCPNCASGDTLCIEIHGEWKERRWCEDCGTTWWPGRHGFGSMVPRRSAPAEVLEQIVGNDDWWWKKDDGKVAVDGWIPIYAPKAWVSGRGQYVRAVPPLVKPPVRDADADAELLRSLATYREGQGGNGRLPSDNDLRRIADRLESEGKHD